MITRTANGVRILASAHPEIGDTKGPRVNKSIGFSGLMFDPWIDAAPQL